MVCMHGVHGPLNLRHQQDMLPDHCSVLCNNKADKPKILRECWKDFCLVVNLTFITF